MYIPIFVSRFQVRLFLFQIDLRPDNCEDTTGIIRSQYTPTIGTAFKISSRPHDSPVQHCVVESPLGQKMHFSRNADINNPDKTR